MGGESRANGEGMINCETPRGRRLMVVEGVHTYVLQRRPESSPGPDPCHIEAHRLSSRLARKFPIGIDDVVVASKVLNPQL